jgi:hypothetical protein
MRENAAMPGDADSHRASAASLVPIAIVAAAVLVLALLVHGGSKGTIVVERITFSATTVHNGKTNRPARFVTTSIDETSADGTLQRSFTSNSITRPGYQQVSAGKTMQLYDPADNTVYVTTEQAQQRATSAEIRSTTPKGSHVIVGIGHGTSVGHSSATVQDVPGRTSIFQRRLRAGQFRLAGRTTIDGRAALKLVQTRATVLAIPNNAGGFESRDTVYVAPGTDNPIEEIINSTLPDLRTTVVDRWQSYNVLPGTPANQRLLSLTARHPNARVSDNPLAYLRATQSEIQTSTRP